LVSAVSSSFVKSSGGTSLVLYRIVDPSSDLDSSIPEKIASAFKLSSSSENKSSSFDVDEEVLITGIPLLLNLKFFL